MTDDPEDQTLAVYKIYVDEEHYFLAEHQKRVAFYTGLVSARLTLTAGGFLKATEWYHFAVLTLGGVLLFYVSTLAKSGTRRIYQRFLEAVTTRAKLEYDLGFSTERGQGRKGWVESEPYSPVRHLESRVNDQWETSKEWVDAHLDKRENYHSVSRKLFSVTKWVGVALIMMAVVFGYMKWEEGRENFNANKAAAPDRVSAPLLPGK